MASHVAWKCGCYVARHDSIPRVLEGRRRGGRPVPHRRDRDARRRAARRGHLPAPGVRIAPWRGADPGDPREPGDRGGAGGGRTRRGAGGALKMALRERAWAVSPHVAPEIAAHAELLPYAT